MRRALVYGIIFFLTVGTSLASSVLFDDAHLPSNSVLEENPVCPLTRGLPGGLHTLATRLGTEGYTWSVLSPPGMFTDEVLRDRCVVVISAPCLRGNCASAYAVEEIAALYKYLLEGGNVVVMGEPYLREPLAPFLATMGVVLGDSIVLHWDTQTYEVSQENLILDDGAVGDDNLTEHDVFNAVDEIVLYGSDFIAGYPATSSHLIDSESLGDPSDAAVCIASEVGEGRIVVIGDSDWLSTADGDGDGIINLNERDNAALITNLVRWLCPEAPPRSYARTIGYWKHQCRGNGHTDVSQDSLAAMEESIIARSSFFTECYDLVGCELMLAPPPNNDMLRKAAQQLYALWLNYMSGKFDEEASPFLVANGPRRLRSGVSGIIARVEGILCDPNSTLEDLEYAKDLAESVNTSGHDEEVVAQVRAVEVTSGETITIPVAICNYSNETRTYEITVEGDIPAYVSPQWLALEAEETGEVMVTVEPTEVGSDCTHIVVVKAKSTESTMPLIDVVGLEISGLAGVPASAASRGELHLQANVASSGEVEIVLSGNERIVGSLSVYDVSGRLVRTVASPVVVEGKTKIMWDGTDSKGRKVSPGIYFARFVYARSAVAAKILIAHQ